MCNRCSIPYLLDSISLLMCLNYISSYAVRITCQLLISNPIINGLIGTPINLVILRLTCFFSSTLTVFAIALHTKIVRFLDQVINCCIIKTSRDKRKSEHSCHIYLKSTYDDFKHLKITKTASLFDRIIESQNLLIVMAEWWQLYSAKKRFFLL